MLPQLGRSWDEYCYGRRRIDCRCLGVAYIAAQRLRKCEVLVSGLYNRLTFLSALALLIVAALLITGNMVDEMWTVVLMLVSGTIGATLPTSSKGSNQS
jgi:hypothetical protein